MTHILATPAEQIDTPPLDLTPTRPSTLAVLRHVLAHWGFDTDEMPIEVVRAELQALIEMMEMYT